MGDWFGNIDRCYGSVKECIAKIKECAKVDLLKKSPKRSWRMNTAKAKKKGGLK